MALLVTLRLFSMAIQESGNGPGPLQISVDLVIPSGGSAGAAAALRQAGAIKYEFVFRAAVWLTRKDGPIHAGEFMIPARSSLADILGILRHGAPVQHQVTIPEGLTGTQIARILNATPAAAGQVTAPDEGSVLPQTYDFILGTSRQAILARAQSALRDRLSAAWAARDMSVPVYSAQAALTLASIVQEETPVAAELPEIAAVYENRLRQGMRLQADPTVIFAASSGRIAGGVGISRADLANPSPYNTYVHAGLPPGPICAPGIAAIQAVLHPAQSQALYFVATGKGGHIFANDFPTQLRNIARYRELAQGRRVTK